ncbi:MAG: methylated-DNA--[protein]-cysteine S-methyltransferase [Planctomycetaceae bacterium]|nr:methylated-DNA--[protein]-cysteine S-methyltransferase [Planctomycetaceae bacterium]
MNASLPITEMEHAWRNRDAAYNGLFFFGVRTTHIFCRPTCPARKPRRENVEYFADADSALAAGYRPCKRCHPLDADHQPAWAIRLLSELRQNPGVRITDDDLRARNMDPATVRRHFLRRFGMTFQQFSRSRRLSVGLDQLHAPGGIDAAVLECGYDSHSGFRDAFQRILGNSPGRFRHDGECIHLSWIASPLGPLVAGATDAGVCLLEFSEPQRFEQQFAALRKSTDAPLVPAPHEHLDALEAQLARYFAGSLHHFSLPLVIRGTPFQERVWNQLLTIPYGETCSYEDLARGIGDSKASRAVGSANGRNRMAILIPCHRVVNKSGALGGYGGGLRRKEFLLNLERGNCRQNQ